MTVKPMKIKLGTRGSPLALRQAEMVREALALARPEVEVETVVIRTSGDWTPEQGEGPLERLGGNKGLFAKEIEEQLLAGAIDAAVHSMKDMETVLPEGLQIAAMLPREDVRDAVILREKNDAIKSLRDLPQGSVIATCSLRRQGMILGMRPDLKIVSMRGNVGTRLQKLKESRELAGIVLAVAGLNRLKMDKAISFCASDFDIVPCAAQGAVGIEIKRNSEELLSIFGQINCKRTMLCASVERAALAGLGGSCRTPVGVTSVLENNSLRLRMRLVSPDGLQSYEESGALDGAASEGIWQTSVVEKFGFDMGRRLREKAPVDLL